MKNAKLSLIFSVLFAMNMNTASAQTNITDNIYTNTTWTASGSPYIIANSIVVFGGAKLVIDPGVTVKFNDHVTIDIRGQLIAQGTASNRIIFTSANAQAVAGAYGGITVSGYSVTNPNPVKLSFCNFSYAQDVLKLGNAIGAFSFRNCNFYNNYNVFYDSPDGGSLSVDSCRFESNNVAMRGSGNVNNCVFVNNITGAIADVVSNSVFTGNTGTAVFAYTILENCEIYSNNIGAEWDGHASTTIMNNNIHDNTIGLKLDRFWNESGITFKNNRICSNTTWNIEYHHTQNADLSKNCFCLTDLSSIHAKIRDGYVDAAYGLVTVNIDNACNAGVTKVEHTPQVASPVKVYPNPFSDQTIIEFGYSPDHNYNITITDQLGRTVSTTEKINSGKVIVERNNLPSGLYYYRLHEDQEVINSGKLVVE